MVAIWYLRDLRHTRYEECQVATGQLRKIHEDGVNLIAENLHSPSMMARRSAAMAKSPSSFTTVTLGIGGTVKNSPGGKA